MAVNFYWYFIAGLVPLVVGAAYYHPALLGKAWMHANGFTKERLEGGNMALIFLFTFLLGCMLAFMMQNVVIHETGVFAMLVPEVLDSGSDAQKAFNSLMEKYSGPFRTFKHGALHGVIAALFFAWPLLAINAMFERRGWKYTAIHLGYWVITLAVMGGLLCEFLVFPELK